MATDLTVPEIDAFLHEPVRLRLLALLSVIGRADFMYLLRQSSVTRGNLSVQMAKLVEAGIVTADKSLVNSRPRTTFALTVQGREALRQYKRTMGEVLAVLPD